MAIVIGVYALLNISLIGSVGSAVLARSPAPVATASGLVFAESEKLVAISRIFRIESKLLALRYQYQRMYQCCSHDLFFSLTLAVHISAQCSNNSSGSSAHVPCSFSGEGESEDVGGGKSSL